MIRKISFQFIRKVIGWSLFVLMVLFIITGFGITQFRTVERITLGLLGKALSFKVHLKLWIPLIILLSLHIIFRCIWESLRKRRGRQ
ncbi:hypothetical protein CEE35_08470 [Candidatus Aerophobetes bacterium Ae_b3b]|nr:MAG: hypothetical protein CEE35_08470 [Candidatus Aerophobetes bacterium Ae_b3b]